MLDKQTTVTKDVKIQEFESDGFISFNVELGNVWLFQCLSRRLKTRRNEAKTFSPKSFLLFQTLDLVTVAGTC